MANRCDLVTITVTQYEEPAWGWQYYGPGRRGLCFGRWALIIELWWQEWRNHDWEA